MAALVAAIHVLLAALQRRSCPPIGRREPFPQTSLRAAGVARALPPVARPPFSRAVYRAQFTTGRSIADRAVLAAILKDAGMPPDALAAAEAAETKSALRQATEEAQSLGIYGAPSFTTRSGELFGEMIAWSRRSRGPRRSRLGSGSSIYSAAWPGSARPSTPFSLKARKKDMDARDKRGHDAKRCLARIHASQRLRRL